MPRRDASWGRGLRGGGGVILVLKESRSRGGWMDKVVDAGFERASDRLELPPSPVERGEASILLDGARLPLDQVEGISHRCRSGVKRNGRKSQC